ncbi:MAG TPA: UDP-N-acetylmuramoyl-L-alanyl-D-glutamate--2,6-diaminopimelate ligase [Candidatus Hydrogenedentes bacterium]|jgi:UDP-N-acetylmuramoyl-L-alanyl-D-glutamate--2,6-diaminopimelate ligase|nr:UDP-N-acetylmuramoyl-L-alanyl-D-glutamate--2,6-diaminopimelate ligase [Candidatus Hydrogenedentota bacterium]HOC68908.1 UDP-N-acetylmuramoyl-L-alanyl-D-glutamate--2,6-diaminopimelate ligase [Candidatus Hydrogenedentota bacterium]HOH28333.1 UDP-N-acetylmuramoyl-L-alanyl-D-glutamate--2,6-diaminopimelate ligase [Candidatus Hydrogenedentota bacterium]
MIQADLVSLLSLPEPLPEFSFTSVTEDSRRVKAGSLFIAVPGGKIDGHAYAEAAVAVGAAAILGDRPDLRELHGLPYIYYAAPRRAAGLIAHALVGNPTRRQSIIGITGTNGKTSTAFLTQQILALSRGACANFGTLGYDLGGTWVDAPHTTPFGEDLAALFLEVEKRACSHVVMEVSSHALDQERVAGIAYNVAAFTNLTQDHLDYHLDMETYLRAKLKLFEKVAEELRSENKHGPCFGVVNAEDAAAPHFIGIMPENSYTYGKGGDVRAESRKPSSGTGTVFHLVSPWGDCEAHVRLAGGHNVLNALCAATIAMGLGVSPEEAAAGLAAVQKVPGRFEAVVGNQPFQVIVDYAHTDDGLRNALRAARAICTGNIIVVFGCGGDRDKGKRPKMGSVAAELADFAIVTSDNPRTEDPFRILLDVELGLQHLGKRKGEDYFVIESRRDAIRQAVSLATPGDLVLIAGKGHETYQIIGKERHHFDDREEALAALESLYP